MREKAAKASSFTGSELAEIVVYLLWEVVSTTDYTTLSALRDIHYYSGRSHSEGFWLSDRADEHWMRLQ